MATEPKRHGWRPLDVMMACMAFLIVILFIAAGVFLYLEKSGQFAALAEAEAKITNLKNRTIPIDFESLEALYNSQTSDTDTAAWIKVFKDLKSNDLEKHIRDVYDSGDVFDLSDSAADKKKLEQLQELVNLNADFILNIRELASHSKPVRFDIDYASDSQMSYQLSNFREIMRLLTCETAVHLEAKDSTKLVQSLITQLEILSIPQGEDLLVNQLFNAALQGIALGNVKQCLEANVLDQPSLEQLSKVLQTLPDHVNNWRQIVAYERAWMLPYLRGQAKFSSSGNPTSKDEDDSQANGKDLLNYLNYMARLESVDWSSWKMAKASLEKIEHDLEANVAATTFWNRHNWRMTSNTISSWTMVGQVLAKNVWIRNQAVLACALRLYQLKHRDFPDRLDQLIDVGVDPTKCSSMADLPFGYQRKNDTAYLWGPIQEDFEYPFEISPTVPSASSNSSAEDRQNIEQALWTLKP